LSPLRNDKQPQCGTLGSEGLLYRPAAGDELFVGPEWRQRSGDRPTRVIRMAESAAIEGRAGEPRTARSARSWTTAPRFIGSGSIGRATAHVATTGSEPVVVARASVLGVVRLIRPAAPGRRLIGPRRLSSRHRPPGSE
jgi:hypothetical protein